MAITITVEWLIHARAHVYYTVRSIASNHQRTPVRSLLQYYLPLLKQSDSRRLDRCGYLRTLTLIVLLHFTSMQQQRRALSVVHIFRLRACNALVLSNDDYVGSVDPAALSIHREPTNCCRPDSTKRISSEYLCRIQTALSCLVKLLVDHVITST